MDKMQFSLYEPVQAHKALAEAWTRIKPLLMAGIGAVIGGIVLLLYMPIFELAGNFQ